MARIYVASSWRNGQQPLVVQELRRAGHEVYDFRNPPHTLKGGFHWSDLAEDWQDWSPEEYRRQLQTHPLAAVGFLSDLRGMQWCDTCVLVMPCGRSAHLELGWCAGRGKRTIMLLSDAEPELMALLADDICVNLNEVKRLLAVEYVAPVRFAGARDG